MQLMDQLGWGSVTDERRRFFRAIGPGSRHARRRAVGQLRLVLAARRSPSPANAMLFCQGGVDEMGEPVPDAIRRIAALDKIALVHFRNIRGAPQRFAEVFIDERDEDMLQAMRTYKEIGFTGPFLLDHMPEMPPPYDAWHARAYANGYIKALLQTVYR